MHSKIDVNKILDLLLIVGDFDPRAGFLQNPSNIGSGSVLERSRCQNGSHESLREPADPFSEAFFINKSRFWHDIARIKFVLAKNVHLRPSRISNK